MNDSKLSRNYFNYGSFCYLVFKLRFAVVVMVSVWRRWDVGRGTCANMDLPHFVYLHTEEVKCNVDMHSPHLPILTQIQFFMTIFHAVSGLTGSCGHPKWSLVLLTSYMCSLVVLFTNFYIRTYTMRRPAAVKADEKKAE
jgi:hypothetical protein